MGKAKSAKGGIRVSGRKYVEQRSIIWLEDTIMCIGSQAYVQRAKPRFRDSLLVIIVFLSF